MNVTKLASGDHELSYFLMSGRIQVDLLNLFRREHNLTSYKLDYVSGHFIGDYVKKIEVDKKDDEDGDMSGSTKIYSQNLSGLEVDCFIHLQSASPISTRLWQNMNYLRFHKINDNVDRYKNRIPYELIKLTQIAVNNEYMNGNKRVYFYVAVMDEKVIMPEIIFAKACQDFLSQNRTILKRIKEKMEFEGIKTNDKKVLVKKFIDTMKVKYLIQPT